MHKTCKLLLMLCLVVFIQPIIAQSVKFSLSPEVLKPGEQGAIKATLVIPEGKKQTVNPQNPEYFYLKADHPDLVLGKVIYPKPTQVVSEEEWNYHPQVTLTLPFTVKQSAKTGNKQIAVLLSYNLCYEAGMCDPPEEATATLSFQITENELIPATVSEAEAGKPNKIVPKETVPLEKSPLPATKPNASHSLGEILKYILFAFLGGIILNITPCVLPILPIRIMSIMNQAQKDRTKVLNHILVYALGVLISFAVMGGIFIALQKAGESVGWGLQNQNPGFVVTLMAIVFVFALSLLGVFELTVPGMNTANNITARGGYGGSFFGGIFAFLMAISCTGPFLGAALPFALALPPVLMLIFFLTIGLGFAFPFLLIGFFPKALKIIPKPGNWMIIFKEVMGFVLLFIVYTQLKTLLLLTDGEYLLKVLWFLVILGFSTWLYGRFVKVENSKLTQWLFTIIPLVIIILAAVNYLPYTKTEKIEIPSKSGELIPAPNTPEGWYIFNADILNKALQEDRAVFLDIGAAWCKNCMTNEKTVLFTDTMMQEFKKKNVLLLRGDFTKKDETLLAWIKKHGRAGVPFNALYIPGEEPYIFSELLSQDEVINALNKIPAKAE
ncbi:MAG TPA: cytochrome c biogenesis protein CcdA [Candidatus Cloacimonas sp.]|nr:cytochrome c biogenesis protein CcdA [Candidatus Cloacimonas sp.]